MNAAKETAATPLLRVSNVETYYGPIRAIGGVSLEVRPGQIVVVLGANGAGKTTILRTVSGLIDPRKGSVELDGVRIDGWQPDRIARSGVAHVPEGREVFPLLSVLDNLRMGAFARRDRRAVAADLRNVLETFPELRERVHQDAGELSGGQQQMLAIGRALLSKPRLMLLDEPSLGLSPALVKRIFATLRRLNEERGLTMLVVEQNANLALHTGHYGYVLENGRIVMEDTCERLAKAEDIQEFYLGAKDAGVRGKRRWKKTKTWR